MRPRPSATSPGSRPPTARRTAHAGPWRRAADRFEWDVAIPANTSATLLHYRRRRYILQESGRALPTYRSASAELHHHPDTAMEDWK